MSRSSPRRWPRTPAFMVVVIPTMLLGACERAVHDMYVQPKYGPGSPSELFVDGSAARTPPTGSVAMAGGETADTSSGRRGHVEPVVTAAAALPLDDIGHSRVSGLEEVRSSNPLPVTLNLLERGRERFAIYCLPCHGQSGDGRGAVVRGGFPAPPSYHTDRLRNAPDSHFYQVISQGYGLMYPYADRVTPQDRWAIVAYIRALQFSQHAPRLKLSNADLRALGASTRSTAPVP